jgi:hypothetical protein
VLTLATRQRDQFRADGLGDSVQLTLAQVRLEEFHVRALYAHDGEARPSISLAYVPTLTHKDFSHCFSSSPKLVLGIYPKLLYAIAASLSTGKSDLTDTPLYPLAITAQSAIMLETGSGRHYL